MLTGTFCISFIHEVMILFLESFFSVLFLSGILLCNFLFKEIFICLVLFWALFIKGVLRSF